MLMKLMDFLPMARTMIWTASSSAPLLLRAKETPSPTVVGDTPGPTVVGVDGTPAPTVADGTPAPTSEDVATSGTTITS